MIPIHTARVESSNAQNILIRLALNELLTPFLLDPPRSPSHRNANALSLQLVPQQIPLAKCCGMAGRLNYYAFQR
jgi:hypothetical protein